MSRRVSIFISSLLAGCTVGPNYSRPATPAPADYSEPHVSKSLGDVDLAAWWHTFGDPELDKLVNRAVVRNLDVETATARITEARAQERVAGAAASPEVSARASATPQRISENAIPLPPGSGGGGTFGLPGAEFTTWHVGFDASWEIDLFGKTRRSVESARARSGAAIWNLRDLQVTTAAETARAYLRLRTLQQQIAIQTAEVERQQRFLRLVEAKTRGGLVTGQDLEQQRSALSAAAAAVAPLKVQANAQIHALGVLTGDTPESLIVELSPTGALPPSPPRVPAGLPSDLLRRRPDIRHAERNLAAATADIGVATADLYPSFSLTAAPALVSTALGSLLAWGSRSYTAGAIINWPIFNGGRTRANIAVANARQEQALVAYRKSILAGLQDVEDALSELDGDHTQVPELETSLSAAQRAEDIARARYRGGLVTYSDVLQAQATRISLENQVIQTRGALARDTVALFKALGGGWPDLAQGGAQP